MVRLKRLRGDELGLTMVELMVALTVSILIVVGSLILLRYMITVADDNRDKTLATLEVQYVGFWISEDIVQAQIINVGNVSDDIDGFPLIITWVTWDGSVEETITYDVENMDGGDLWRMMRTREVKVDGEFDPLQSGTSQVAQYLVPWDDVEGTGTRCCRMVYDAAEYGTMKSMIVHVAAKADRSEASSSYEIYPRTVVEWWPSDGDGNYIGTDCPGS